MYWHLTENDFKLFLELLVSKGWAPEHLLKRKLHVHYFDGYGQETDRSWFFCVEGSSNKFCGHILRGAVTLDSTWEVETTYGRFYFVPWLRKVAKRNFYAGRESHPDWQRLRQEEARKMFG